MLLGGLAARVLRQLLVVVLLGLRPLVLLLLLLLLLLGRRLVPAAVLGIQTVVP